MDAYTIPEAARAAGLTPREVRMRIEEGDLRAFIRAGRRMLEATEVERLAERSMRLQPVPDERTLEEEVEELRLELARARERIAELEATPRRPALTPLFTSTEPEPAE